MKAGSSSSVNSDLPALIYNQLSTQAGQFYSLPAMSIGFLKTLIRPAISRQQACLPAVQSINWPLNVRFLSTRGKQLFHLLNSNPSLVTHTTFTSQISSTLIRTFATTSRALYYYRDPKNHVVGGGLLSRAWSRIPDGIKLLGLFGVSSYLVIFVAVPILVMVVPPLILGGWLFVRINRYLRNRAMKRRWESIADSTLVYYPHTEARTNLFVPPPEQINGGLANFEINRILDAFWKNEHGIANYFKIEDIDNLALGTLEAVEYSYNSTSVVFADDFSIMVVQERPLYNKAVNKEIANVILTLKSLEKPRYEDVDPSANIGKSLVEIEIIPRALFAKSFVFKTPSVSTKNRDDDGTYDDDNTDDDGFINVKGKTTVL
jgi:hypothetical protein